jgi:hypothetical protein
MRCQTEVDAVVAAPMHCAARAVIDRDAQRRIAAGTGAPLKTPARDGVAMLLLRIECAFRIYNLTLGST